MDNLPLSRCLILQKALEKLDFEEPEYIYEPWDDGLFRCKIKFTTPTGPDEEIPDNIHEVWSGWFPLIEEARENAAHRALRYLEKIAIFHVEDYSMTIIKKLRSQNNIISEKCSNIAKETEQFFVIWSKINMEINKAALSSSCCVDEYDTKELDMDARYVIESTLYQIMKFSRELSDCYNRNKKQMEKLYHSNIDLIRKYLSYEKDERMFDPEEPVSTSVFISITKMLKQILFLLETDPAEYTYIKQDDESIITCCTFCKDQSHLPNIKIDTICGSPFMDKNLSEEDAALRSLRHLDICYNLVLFDYNYETKEKLLDENRSLSNNKRILTSMLVDIYNTIWRDSLVRLLSLIKSARGIIDVSDVKEGDHRLSSMMKSVTELIEICHRNLSNIYDETTELIEFHSDVKAITSRMYCHIV